MMCIYFHWLYHCSWMKMFYFNFCSLTYFIYFQNEKMCVRKNDEKPGHWWVILITCSQKSTIQTLTFDTRLNYTAMSKQTALHECKNRIFDDTDPQINKKRMRVEERADLASAETNPSSNTELNSNCYDSKMAVDTNSDLPLKSNPKIVSIGHYSLNLLCDFKKVPK